VIPNKAFQALASGVPLITGDTPGSRELLTDEDSALLVPPGDPSALADAIRRLASDSDLAQRVAARGDAVYREHASEQVLGERWRSLIERLL
jgi:glycosyltransferase involved in cell wall biosynthesis